VVTFTFQTDSAAANNTYKIAVITAQTSTSAYVVNFNDFKIGPQTSPIGAPITDWQSYGSTSSYTGFGTVSSNTQLWRRVGDSVELQIKFTCGTTTAVEARIALPSGLTSSDTVKIPSIQSAGMFIRNNNGGPTSNHGGSALIEPSVTYMTLSSPSVMSSTVSNSFTKAVGSTDFNLGDIVSIFAKIPIQGWSSNVQISSDTDTRVVAAKAQVSSGSPVANSQINYSTIILDTHGAITTGAGWRYTAPVSGIYRVSITHSTGVSNNLFGLFKNGTMESNMAFVLNAICGSSTTVSLVAGDYIDIRPGSSNGSYTSGGGTGSSVANSNYITIERLSGPSVVAATESVNASYYLSANFASSPTVPVNFDTKEFDSHNAVTTSPTAWRFTAPVSGTYDVGAYFYPTSGASNLNLYKNGSLYKVVAYAVNGTSKSSGVVPMKLNAGDYVDLRTDGSTTVTGGAQTSTNTAWFQVKRTGN
ncbi:hypothetical protein EBZ39_05635, partial [bacterium]|nr:hypothetical protein [bacterium]